MKNKIIDFFLFKQGTTKMLPEEIKLMQIQQEEFYNYIWGRQNSLNELLINLDHRRYGSGIELILFEFYVNPNEDQKIRFRRKLGNFSTKQKSIGIPILITNDNFFDKSEMERYQFLKETIFKMLALLNERVERKKLDTNMKELKRDLQKMLQNYQYCS